jgi:hypothetical protein
MSLNEHPLYTLIPQITKDTSPEGDMDALFVKRQLFAREVLVFNILQGKTYLMHEDGWSLFNLIRLMQLTPVSGARYENQFGEVQQGCAARHGYISRCSKFGSFATGASAVEEGYMGLGQTSSTIGKRHRRPHANPSVRTSGQRWKKDLIDVMRRSLDTEL